MVQYLYANNLNGSLVDISNVTHENREKYYCPSCGMEMSAVLGNKREHHFRHKGDSCSYETYLHKISKLLLKWRFDNNSKFEIAYYGTKNCPNVNCCLRDSSCQINTKQLQIVNLKDRYDICEIEGSYNNFRADIKLSSSETPDATPLFLEVAVSHKCSPEKISSGVPIIEISVSNERDVLQPLEEPKSEEPVLPRTAFPYMPQPMEEKIKFYNFDRTIYPERRISRFLIYKDNDGYIRGRIEKSIGLCSTIVGHHNKFALFEIQFDDATIANRYRYIWYFGMHLAVNEGINIRDCRICRNYRSCRIQLPTNEIDVRTNKRLFVNVPISKFRNNHFRIANRCNNFTSVS